MSTLHPKRLQDPEHRKLIRSMPCGTIPLRWHGEISRYEEEDRQTDSWTEPQLEEEAV